MDSLLRRFPNLSTILIRKEHKRWYRQRTKQSNNSSQLYGKTFQSSSRSIQVSMESMWQQNNQQCSGFGQLSRYYNSTDARTKYRQWEPVGTRNDPTQSFENLTGLPFKIVSYNILAQDLLVEHLHLYRGCNQMFLKWSYRLARLTEEIVAQQPDILCLQEVQENHFGDIESNIKGKLPMQCVFKKKTGFKSDGCAIFYNKNLFELEAADLVEYYQPGFELLDRHNIALIVRLRCISQPKVSFLVCTTHMLYNPRRQDVRLAQTMVLLAEIDRHSVVGCDGDARLKRMPIILTGDFNFKPNSAPFALLTFGKLCYEELSRNTLKNLQNGGSPPTGKCFVSPQLGITDTCQHIDCLQSNYKKMTSRLHNTHKTSHSESESRIEFIPELFSTGTLSHDLNFKSAYDHFNGRSFGSTYQEKWITVDHIFYSAQEDVDQGSLKLLSIYQLPVVEQCPKIGDIPNEGLGSDHLMLASRFCLSFPNES